MASSTPKNLAEALIAFQASVPSIETNRKGQHGAFADLPHILSIIRPSLAKAGLAVSQILDTVEGEPGLRTTLMHSSGEKETAVTPLCINKEPMKTRDGRTIALNPTMEFGKAVTYTRRYGLQSILGISIGMEDIDPDLPVTDVATPTQQQEPVKAAAIAAEDPLDDTTKKEIIGVLMSCKPAYRDLALVAFIEEFGVSNAKVSDRIQAVKHGTFFQNYFAAYPQK